MNFTFADFSSESGVNMSHGFETRYLIDAGLRYNVFVDFLSLLSIDSTLFIFSEAYSKLGIFSLDIRFILSSSKFKLYFTVSQFDRHFWLFQTITFLHQ